MWKMEVTNATSGPTTIVAGGTGNAAAAELEAAGILTVTTEADGTVTYALTREGKAIGRQLAMTQGDDARLAILNELLDASPDA